MEKDTLHNSTHYTPIDERDNYQGCKNLTYYDISRVR